MQWMSQWLPESDFYDFAKGFGQIRRHHRLRKNGADSRAGAGGRWTATVAKIFAALPIDAPRYTVAGSTQNIILDPAIGSVFVCGVNDVNMPLTIAALKAGKHVFCKKPPAFNPGQVREIMVAERASGMVFVYGFNHLRHGACSR